jgi:3-oxoadipate enol-lactonase/4-carboxymuconolactone decarboxylase
VWTRPGLDPQIRRLLVLAMTASPRPLGEFRLHLRTGLAGLELPTWKKLLQVAIYAGVPATNHRLSDRF